MQTQKKIDLIKNMQKEMVDTELLNIEEPEHDEVFLVNVTIQGSQTVYHKYTEQVYQLSH